MRVSLKHNERLPVDVSSVAGSTSSVVFEADNCGVIGDVTIESGRITKFTYRDLDGAWVTKEV